MLGIGVAGDSSGGFPSTARKMEEKSQKYSSNITSATLNRALNIVDKDNNLQNEQQQVTRRIEHLKNFLTDIKRQIEETKISLEKLELDLQDPNCTSNNTQILMKLAKEKFLKNETLRELLALEETTSKNLQSLYRSSWDTSISRHLWEAAKKPEDKSLVNLFKQRRNFLLHRRINRECKIRHEAQKMEQRAQAHLTSMISQYVKQPSDESIMKEKIREIRKAKKKVEHHLQKTMNILAEEKFNSTSDHLLKQERQRAQLIKLKRQMDDQLRNMQAKNEARKIRQAKEEYEKNLLRTELVSSGHNPYIVEHLLKVEEKRQSLREQFELQEKAHLTEVLQLQELEKAAQAKEEAERRKWNKFWADKVKNKIIMQKRKEKELYYDGLDSNGVLTVKVDDHELHHHPKRKETEDDGQGDHHSTVLSEIIKKEPLHTYGKVAYHLDQNNEHSSHRMSFKAHDHHRHSITHHERGHSIPTHRDKVRSHSITSHQMDRGFSMAHHIGPHHPGDNHGLHQQSHVFHQESWLTKRLEDELYSERTKRGTTTSSSGTGSTPLSVHTIPHSKRHSSIRRKTKIFPFVWTPENIIFKDFDVGHKYKRKVTIHNVAYEKQKFVYNGLIDDEANNNTSSINEVITVHFTAPHPLPPGLGHDFEVAFHPTTELDWSGHLHFHYDEGEFRIPVKCMQKRIVPIIHPNPILFIDIVPYTHALMTATIKNDGMKTCKIVAICQIENSSNKFEADFEEFLASDLNVSASRAENKDKMSHSILKGKSTVVTFDQKESFSTPRDLKKPSKPIKSNRSSSGPTNVGEKMVRSIINEVVDNVTSSIFVAYIKDTDRTMPEGSTKHLHVHFRPRYERMYKSSFEILLDDGSSTELKVEGRTIENPVEIHPLNVDMKICKMDHFYQQVIDISLINKQNSGKVVTEVPHVLHKYVDVVPKECLVLAHTKAEFCVRFHPVSDMLEREDLKEFLDQTTNIIDFPVKFHLNFPFPVYTPISAHFMAVLTNQNLKFVPEKTLDFGECNSNEAVRLPLRIYNNALVPQHIGFMELPKCVMIKPNHGFVTLLPQETRELDVLLSLPEKILGTFSATMKCCTTDKREYSLSLVARNRPAMAYLSHTKIHFPMTCCTSFSTAVVYLVLNHVKKTHDDGHDPTFIFHVGPNVPIKIYPSAGVFHDQKEVKILVKYEPDVIDAQVIDYLNGSLEAKYLENQTSLARELEGLKDLLKLSAESGGSNKKLRKSKQSSSLEETILTQHLTMIKPESPVKTQRTLMTISAPSSEDMIGAKKSIKSYKSHAHIIADIEERTSEIKAEMKKKFKPRRPSAVSFDEFTNAKQDLIKTLSPTCSQYKIPCYVTDPFGHVEVNLLTVVCPMQKPDIMLLDPSHTVDFGTVATNQKEWREIHLYNVSKEATTLKMDIIHPYGPFVQCNALRPVPPEHVLTLKFRFQASEPGTFEETITIHGGCTSIRLTLFAKAVNPKFSIKPFKIEHEIPGPVELKTSGSISLELVNVCPAPLEFTISREKFTHEGLKHRHKRQSTRVTLSETPRAPPPTEAEDDSEESSALRSKRHSFKGQNKSITPPIQAKETSTPPPSSKKRVSIVDRKSIKSNKRRSSGSQNIFIIENESETLTFSLNQLTRWMEQNGEYAYFDVFPKKVKVGPKSKEKIDITFVPVDEGRYSATFKIFLGPFMVHEFIVKGVSEEIPEEVEQPEAPVRKTLRESKGRNESLRNSRRKSHKKESLNTSTN